MVVVPAGKFMMGSVNANADEKPVHDVTIPQPFAAGKYEVTFAEWEACVAGGGCLSNKSPAMRGGARDGALRSTYPGTMPRNTCPGCPARPASHIAC